LIGHRSFVPELAPHRAFTGKVCWQKTGQHGANYSQNGHARAGSARDDRRQWAPLRPQPGARTCPFAAPFAAPAGDCFARGINAGDRLEAGGRLRLDRQQTIQICRVFSTGATGLEPATSGVTGRRSGRLLGPQWWAMVGVVLLENGLQSVGEGVGGADAEAPEAASQAEFRPKERRDRTQEVAGSSPASSTSQRRVSAAARFTGETRFPRLPLVMLTRFPRRTGTVLRPQRAAVGLLPGKPQA
jgi:hypothetical protein